MYLVPFIALFQFHLVRLKGSPATCNGFRPESVSIPFSTIKSIRHIGSVRRAHVSIPFSTIKR